MRVPKEITEDHIAYFIGDIRIKYRGKRIKDAIISKRDFYEINIYSTEIFNTSKASVNDYNNESIDFIVIDIPDVLIEKPDCENELFLEDLKNVKIYNFSNHS